MKSKLSLLAALAVSLLGAALPARAQFFTDVTAYALPTWHADYVVEPILSAGDQVPLTSNAAKVFQFVGIPDGMGSYSGAKGTTIVNVAHEMGWTQTSEPVIGGPLAGSALVRGAFVSSFVLRNTDRAVLSGDLAFYRTYQDGTLVGDIATDANGQPAFARFCSAYQGGPFNGFDRPIFFANEEAGIAFGATYFNASTTNLGSQSVAIMDQRAHALSVLGHFSKENTVVRPYTGRGDYKDKIVILSFEDGPAAAPHSGVFMYVGIRQPRSQNPDPIARTLERNGLIGGNLYYLRSQNSALNSEATFSVEGNSVTCEWVLAPNAATQNETDLKNEMIAQDFFTFSRPEDGHYNPRNPNQWVFVTTGEGDQGNDLGRIYELRLNPVDPIDPCTLVLKYDADATSPAVDGPLAPDNLVFSANGDIMVQEDGTGTSRPQYNNRNRSSGIWKFNIAKPFSDRTMIVGQTDIGRDNIVALGGTGTVVGAQTGFALTRRGLWETSGIIDHVFARGKRAYSGYLFNVQAHGPTTAPAANTVEDGQILFMAPCPR